MDFLKSMVETNKQVFGKINPSTLPGTNAVLFLLNTPILKYFGAFLVISFGIAHLVTRALTTQKVQGKLITVGEMFKLTKVPRVALMKVIGAVCTVMCGVDMLWVWCVVVGDVAVLVAA